jgi:hypothetical protein
LHRNLCENELLLELLLLLRKLQKHHFQRNCFEINSTLQFKSLIPSRTPKTPLEPPIPRAIACLPHQFLNGHGKLPILARVTNHTKQHLHHRELFTMMTTTGRLGKPPTNAPSAVDRLLLEIHDAVTQHHHLHVKSIF